MKAVVKEGWGLLRERVEQGGVITKDAHAVSQKHTKAISTVAGDSESYFHLSIAKKLARKR